MLGWAIGFFVAALVAAVFGFGGIASAFTGIAVLLFWVFLALFVASLIFGGFRGGAAHAEGHTSHARFGSMGLIALVLVVGLGVYVWMDNDMSAERAGRVIDRETAQLADNTGEAIEEVGDRTENVIENAQTDIRRDAADGLDEASDNVEPENDSN